VGPDRRRRGLFAALALGLGADDGVEVLLAGQRDAGPLGSSAAVAQLGGKPLRPAQRLAPG
jgi:hypothetical protein